MRVGIDTLGCDSGHSGIGMYLKSLALNLPEDSGLSYELFGCEIDRYTFESNSEHIAYAACSVLNSVRAQRIYHFLNLNSFIKKQKYDAVLIPAGSRMLPFKRKIPIIAVIQDVMSDQLSHGGSEILNKLLVGALKRADAIIAPSLFIKKNLISLGVDSSKIEVIYNGLDHTLFYPHTELEGTSVDIKPFAIKKPYFIYPSRLQNSQKKHIQLIEAFSIFKKTTGLPHRLVLAGSAGPESEEIHKAASLSQYASDIFLTGFFPHESLPELYSCADACVFPSVSEGVGLSVIEAMACGIPVACAKAGALPDVAGNNAVYFDADNPSDIADALKIVVSDKEKRESLIQGGFEWTKRFSWDKTAEKTIEVIKKTMK